MKILFTSDRKDGPSTIWYQRQLTGLRNLAGVSIDFHRRNYSDYDVILFMGYDPCIAKARRENATARIGVIDVRPASKQEVRGADFIIANGIEMRDWYLKLTANVYLYPPYPLVPPCPRNTGSKCDSVVLGYHGNLVHLQGMFPRVTRAIEELARSHKVEVWALYNVRSLGSWRIGVPMHPNVKVRHMQWSESGYEELLARTDVGIGPNMMPLRKRRFFRDSGSVSKRMFLDDETDYLMRYKATSNAGRMLLFAQHGIPVVSDMYPSAVQVIEDGVDGFVCYSSAGWFRALELLSSDPGLREAMGHRFRSKFENRWSTSVLNRGLVEFILNLRVGCDGFSFDWEEFGERPGGFSYYRSVKATLVRNYFTRLLSYLRRRLAE